MKRNRKFTLTIISILLIIVLLILANNFMNPYYLLILNLCAVYTIIGLSLNLILGFTGLFSLGHAGFMAIGAYTTGLLTMSLTAKQMNFFVAPLISPLNKIVWPFFPALIAGGLLSAFVAFLIGAPVLRLKGDYLAISTLGFSEIIRVVLTNTQSLTNGALGLIGIPTTANLWWTFGTAGATLVIFLLLINSSYGRALKAIREDETAAEAMGINLYKHKVLSFCISAFFAGIGGGLLGSLLGAIDPLQFRFLLTFNILLIVVLGGMGSLTGTVLSAFAITVAGEALRFLDAPMIPNVPALPGLRMVVFSALLMISILFFRSGIMGTKEFSWDGLLAFINRKPLSKGGE